MNKPLVVWGAVLLVAFYAADYLALGGMNPAWLWVGLAVLFNLLHMWMGKQMRNAPKGMKEVWMSVGAFGLIATLLVAFGFFNVDFSWLMALWLLLVGAAMFAGGHASRNPGMDYGGLVLIVSSLAVLQGFWAQNYFLAGALLFGLFGLVNGYLAK